MMNRKERPRGSEGALRPEHAWVVAGLAAILVAGCMAEPQQEVRGGGWAEQAVGTTEPARATITYQEHVRPVLEAHCVGCHKPGGIGPMRLDDWTTVKRFAPAVVDAVQARRMPPWPASDACHEIADSGALPEADRARFAQWERDGYQEGRAEDYVHVPGPARAELGPATRSMKAEEGFTPAPFSDTYRCFNLGTLPADTYLTAIEIVPGRRAEVHHAQLHRVEPENVAQLNALDAAEPGGGWTCSSNGVTSDAAPPAGDPSAPDRRVPSQNLFSYRPGAVPVTFAKGDAVYLKGGSALVLQMHYNTQFLGGAASPEPDQSRADLWTLPEGERPNNVIYRVLISSPLNARGDGTADAIQKSSIPANATNVTGYSEYTMSYLSHVTRGFRGNGTVSDYIPGEIVGITPHAHAWAKRLSARLVQAPGERCLVDVPQWNYAWQFDYLYREGVRYTPEDVLHVECNYSNTADDQPVVNGQRLPVRTIAYGERTLDEMCVHYLWLRFKYDDFANTPFKPWLAPTQPAAPATAPASTK